MTNKNNTGDYYSLIHKHFIEYLAITFFLANDEGPPQKPDLLEFIHDNSRDAEFIDFLIENIHDLTFNESSADDFKTAIQMHLQNNKKGEPD